MFNIVERRRWFYLLSLAVIVPGVIAMIYSTITSGVPVRLGIDFTGGSLFRLQFTGPATEEAIGNVFTNFGEGNAVIQRIGQPEDNTWQVRGRLYAVRKTQPDQIRAERRNCPAGSGPFDVR